MRNPEFIPLVLAWVGTGCWAVCFWWMHRLSAKQEVMLKDLHEMTSRIEHLSKMGHDMISDVHPVVGEIKASVKDVATAMAESNA